MNSKNVRLLILFISILFLLLLTSCAAGNPKFTNDTPAGFLYGLWHGIIAFISLVIHVFNDSVVVYEVNNTGGWYDLGFLLGATCIWGGGSHASCRSAAKKKRDKEWEEVGEKVESKIMHKLKDWAETEESKDPDDDWDEICGKVESKLKRKIRDWAEKD